jgi:CHAP domain
VAVLLSHLAYSGSDLLTSCTAPEIRSKILSVANGELYVREDLGSNDALRIREYKRAINSKFNYPVEWCAIFVSWVYTTNGLKDKLPYGFEWVPSWSARPQFIIYKRGVKGNQFPCPGDVVTYYYPRLGHEGHIGIVIEWPVDGDYFKTIEGNWNRGVRIVIRRKTDAYRVMRFV